MLSAVNKLTFILSEAGISVSLSPSVPPFPCNEPCQERSGVALIGQEGTGGSRTLLTGWEGGSWLPAQPVTACSANLEMLLAEVWSPWPPFLPSVLRGGPQVTPGELQCRVMLCVFEFIPQSILSFPLSSFSCVCTICLDPLFP